jgi:hypothetical protein
METFAVALEIGPKRKVFAQAIEWIGWCCTGKNEMSALNQLLSAGQRYAQVAARAGIPFVAPTSFDAFEIVERTPGTATTDFGALSVLFAADVEPLTEADIGRLVSLLTACWSTFDNALQNIPADLYDVKPERGRSPSAIRLHLLEADQMHLSAFGPAFRQPDPAHVAQEEAEVREQIIAQLRMAPPNESTPPRRRYGFSWTPRFAVRRSAWHALDHAWELEDRA